VIPDEWSSSDAAQQFKDELIAQILHDESPFDAPMPYFTVAGHVFIFTGKFEIGSREACQNAIIARGGRAPDQKRVSRNVDYLVIGTMGSTAWKKVAYGTKIEDALLARASPKR
jgi:NAD-dependent DNA ligase